MRDPEVSMTARAAALALPFAALLTVASAPVLLAEEAPVEGTWTLAEKLSRNVPESIKGVDLKIGLRGKLLVTERLVSGRTIGDPLLVSLDGVSHETELGHGQRAAIDAKWVKEGRSFQQNVRMLTSSGPGLPAVQKTLVTVSDDNQTMTRVQTTIQFGKTDERVLVYRRK